jgi:hypothetical protein
MEVLNRPLRRPLPRRSMACPCRSITRVLMVCTGNICRSPMAVVLWRDRFRDRAMLVGSAGLNALTGHGIDPDAKQCWPIMA